MLISSVVSVPQELVATQRYVPCHDSLRKPRRSWMAEAAANALGHRINEFRGYRVRMRYPPVRTVAILRHGLAEPPR